VAGVAFATGAFSAHKPNVSSVPALLPPPRPWLGVMTTSSPGGALVTQVIPGGPADQAGLQQGDVIMAVNTQQVGGPTDIAGVVDARSIGDQVLLRIERGGQVAPVGVTLGRRP
jgi:S1-C subfamily serine protease